MLTVRYTRELSSNINVFHAMIMNSTHRTFRNLINQMGKVHKMFNIGLPNRLEDAASFHEAKVEQHLVGIPYNNIEKLGAMDIGHVAQ